jgi:hypothetical protein
MKKIVIIGTLGHCLLLAVLCGFGCKTDRANTRSDAAPPPIAGPGMVYVSDFELGWHNIKHEDGRLSGRSGRVGRIGDRLGGVSDDPAARARQIVDLMSDSLVMELRRAGLPARRLRLGEPLPASGWLVRGVFTEVQEGNRLQRAMIGLGRGQTDVQVISTIDDLSEGWPKPLYEMAADASSGQRVGASPMLIISPYAAPVRFVMAGQDLDKNVRQTAAQIARQMAEHIKHPQN